MDKRICIVGGAGFIGHHLAIELACRGANVTIIDSMHINNKYSRFVSSKEKYLDIIKQRTNILKRHDIWAIEEDAKEHNKILQNLKSIRPNIIIHLAAVSHANVANQNPHIAFENSIRTLENVLDYARNSNVEHFIYSSSSMVYGNFENGSVTEDSPCNPIEIYGFWKLMAEKMVLAYNQCYDLNYTIIRPSALYGERCISRRVIQIFIENALEGKEITIRGTGEESLDFTYIGDLVQGFYKIINEKTSKNQVFNLTYGQSRHIHELVDITKQHFAKICFRYEPKNSKAPNRGTLCIDKAKKMLNYQPKTNLEIGFNKYLGWYRSRNW